MAGAGIARGCPSSVHPIVFAWGTTNPTQAQVGDLVATGVTQFGLPEDTVGAWRLLCGAANATTGDCPPASSVWCQVLHDLGLVFSVGPGGELVPELAYDARYTEFAESPWGREDEEEDEDDFALTGRRGARCGRGDRGRTGGGKIAKPYTTKHVRRRAASAN